MKQAAKRWMLRALRLGLCVAAVAFLAYNVKWHDTVRLAAPPHDQVRLLADHPARQTMQVEIEGQTRELPYTQVYQDASAGSAGPVVEYGIRSVVQRLDLRLAFFSVLLFAPVWFIQAYRLVLMVAIHDMRLSLWNSVKLTFAGCFFNFALPGSYGGDVIKAYYVSRYTHHRKTEVVTTVFIDRVFGLLAVVILASIAMLVRWDPREFGRLETALIVIGVAVIVGGCVIFSRRVRAALRLTELVQRLPRAEQILRVGRSLVVLRHHPGRVTAAMGLSLVLQALCMLSAAVMGWALGMKGDLSQYFVYVSVGFLIAAIPITPPQAFGVLEAAYVQFFTHAGLASASQAVALALAVRLIQLVWALPGVLVPLLGAHLPSRAELEAEEPPPDDPAPVVALERARRAGAEAAPPSEFLQAATNTA